MSNQNLDGKFDAQPWLKGVHRERLVVGELYPTLPTPAERSYLRKHGRWDGHRLEPTLNDVYRLLRERRLLDEFDG